jgi:membrane protein DedA with SNARE-associated domain
VPPIRWRQHFESAALPLAFLAIMLAYEALILAGIISDTPHQIRELGAFLSRYGAAAIVLSAFIEGLFMVTFYVPGASLVLIAAVFFSDKSNAALWHLSLEFWLGFLAAAPVNYLIGRQGLYRFFRFMGVRRMLDDTRRWMERWGALSFLLASYDATTSLTIVGVCAGIARMNSARALLLTAIGLAVWTPLLVFGMAKGMALLLNDDLNNRLNWLAVAFFAFWALLAVGKGVYTDLRNPNTY